MYSPIFRLLCSLLSTHSVSVHSRQGFALSYFLLLLFTDLPAMQNNQVHPQFLSHLAASGQTMLLACMGLVMP